jgi:K+-sensing histidine kinase KdpD
MFASYLAQYHDARIHLVALKEDAEGEAEKDNSYLYKAYQLLRDNTDLAIECHPVMGENIADTTLQYAEKVNADLIVVQPGKEVELPGFLNNIFSRFLFSASRIPVMAV